MQPDVRVPVTLESVQAKIDGQDPVLDAALETLAAEAAERASARLTEPIYQWTSFFDAALQEIAVEAPSDYTIAFAQDGTLAITADCNQVSGNYVLGEAGAITITLGVSTLAACPEGSLSEAFLEWLRAVRSLEFVGTEMALTANIEDSLAAVLVFQKAEGTP